MAEIMFESFVSVGVAVAMQPVLSLYASGRKNGVAVDSGERRSDIVPVYEGIALRQGIVRLDFAGGDVTDCLMKILNDSGFSFSTHAAREIVRDIKEKLAYVAVNYDNEVKAAYTNTSLQKTYELPDGKVR